MSECPHCQSPLDLSGLPQGQVFACPYCSGQFSMPVEADVVSPIHIDGQFRVFAKWNSEPERLEVIRQLDYLEQQCLLELAGVESRIRLQQTSHDSVSRGLGPTSWYGGGQIGAAIRLAQVAAKAASGMSNAATLQPLLVRRHQLETLLLNLRSTRLTVAY